MIQKKQRAKKVRESEAKTGTKKTKKKASKSPPKKKTKLKPAKTFPTGVRVYFPGREEEEVPHTVWSPERSPKGRCRFRRFQFGRPAPDEDQKFLEIFCTARVVGGIRQITVSTKELRFDID